MAKTKKKKKTRMLLVILVLIIIACIFGMSYSNGDKKTIKKVISKKIKEATKKETPKEEKKIHIINEESNTRPIAVMINNHSTARKYHSGLQDAYIIYEIIVEGGISRYLAVFKDQNTDKIGSIRSSRHYFLDYALENDAIYVHWGWSPQAQSDIKTLKINNINGLTYEGKYFYREEFDASLEHRGFTKMSMIKDAIKKLNYRDTTNEKTLLKYSVDAIDNSNISNSKKADTIEIQYSNSLKDKYIYNEEEKVYYRYVNDKEHVDYQTKKQYTFKNIITYQVSNYTISGDSKGRQDIKNIGSGNGYYISNGYAIPIKWEKKSRAGKTNYYYEDGTELKVNDGNTFIQIQPSNKLLTIN